LQTRLNGVNWHQLPINRPVCPVISTLRDGGSNHYIPDNKLMPNYKPNRRVPPSSLKSLANETVFSRFSFFFFSGRFDASGETDVNIKMDAETSGQPQIASREQGALIFGKRPVEGLKERTRGPKFSEHYSQAQMFYNSLSPFERCVLSFFLAYGVWWRTDERA
jgi:catalase